MKRTRALDLTDPHGNFAGLFHCTIPGRVWERVVCRRHNIDMVETNKQTKIKVNEWSYHVILIMIKILT